MSERSALVLPEGLELDIEGDALVVRYPGDIHLQTTLGKALGRVEAGGDLVVDLERVSGTLIAGGKLVVRGEVDAHSLSGRVVELGRQRVRCESITAARRIVIGAASLTVDAIIAPSIVIDPKAFGRVTVIESHNDRGATKIKGGFSLADYDDMFGSADDFLGARGLSRLDADADFDPDAIDAPTLADEDVDDPESLSIDDIEPIEEFATSADPALDAQLDDAVARVVSCYEGAELPPAVGELRDLVAARDYDRLGDRITDVWNHLLGYHQKRGIRPHHQVTHAFNVIHGLLNG